MRGVGCSDCTGDWRGAARKCFTIVAAVLTLALDTTSRGGSVAVLRDDTVLSAVAGEAERTHGERLPQDIDAAIQRAGVTLADLTLLVVAAGPGAFTGLRIGLAAMQGIAMVLRLPTIGVSALDALALAAMEHHHGGGIAAWMDAHRGEVFASTYTHGASSAAACVPLSAPIVGRPADVMAQTVPADDDISVIGDGAVRYQEQLQHYSSRAVVMAGPALLAPYLARLGRARVEQAGPPHALQPLYVRRADAELARQKRQPS
jgi:tRNA threonylcarbamoyladenosine biosynthesis protein TsaB